MLAYLILFTLFSLNLYVPALSDGECPDIHGRIISPGLHYVPGPDTCTLCICENGQPKWCKAVLCSPPQDCKSFRLGNTCCEFICLDDALSKHPDSVLDGSQDFGLRLIATAVVVILFLSMLFFMVHRLRQRKLRGHQNRQMNEDQRSLASIGYIGGSLGYLGGGCEDGPSHFPSLWKPPGNYFPRGEAPPPYDEAVAQARAEAISINNMSGYHRSFPLNAATNMENLIRIENSHSPQQRSHNIQSSNDHSVSQFHNSGNRLAAPFYLNNLSSNHSSVGNSIADMRDRQVIVMGTNQARNFTAQHSITSSAGNNNFISTLKITSSLSAVTARNREHADFLFAPTPHQGSNSNSDNHASTQPRVLPASSIDAPRQHRTIPRMLSALDDMPSENTNFSHLKQRGLHSKSNRDINVFRASEETSRHSSSSSSRMSSDVNNSRTSNENGTKLSGDDTRLLLDSNSHRLSKENVLRFGNEMAQSDHQKGAKDLPRSLSEVSRQLAGEISRVENETSRSSVETTKRQSSGSLGRLLERHPLLPMPVDTTPCNCSYDSEPLAVLNDDQDDYHSECENCKSANGSRYYLDESEEGSELCETMTLHRRPLPEHTTEDLHQLPTSLTLPVKTKRNRCQPGTRDAWFSSMPGTSSSEED